MERKLRIKNKAYVNFMYALVIFGIALKSSLRWFIAPAVQLVNFMYWILITSLRAFILVMIAAVVIFWFTQQVESTVNIVLFAISASLIFSGIIGLKSYFTEIEEKRAAEKHASQKPICKPTLWGVDVPSAI